MVHHRKYPLFTVDLYIGAKVTQIVAQFPPYHVTYAPTKFEAATSKGFGVYALTRKYIS